MATQEPLVNFYDLSGPKPWSPACWTTRYALNYKCIPYKTIQIAFPAIKPKCQELLKDMTGLEETVPIIEVLGADYKALNDSTPIAVLLNERFTEKDGFKELKGIEDVPKWEADTETLGRYIIRWIMNDIYENALDPNDGSKEYFKSTREAYLKCELKDVTDVKGGGEAAVVEAIKTSWMPLKERMQNEDGSGDPTYVDFQDASLVKWIEASSSDKAKKLMDVYGDDTFTKLMKKVEKYSS